MKIVFTCGVFDLLHEGHLKLFKEMRSRGDLVAVIIHDGFTTFRNKKKLPIENLEKRTRNLVDTELVDMIFYTFEEEPHWAFEKFINRYGGMFKLEFMRGDDWQDFPGKKTLEIFKIPIVYKEYSKEISSSKLRNEI